MINNNVLFNLLKYSGIILVILACILLGKFISKILNETTVTFEYLKNKKKSLILSTVLLFLGILFVFLSYYSNPISYNYLIAANIELPNFGNYLLIFLSVLFLVFSLLIFIGHLVLYYFLESSYKKAKKVFWLMIVSFVILLIAINLVFLANAKYWQYPLCNRIYIGTKGIYLVTTYTGYDWHSAPTDGFGLQIALYAVCILTGACTTLMVVSHKIKIEYGQGGLLSNLFLIAFPSGIIGARIWYVIGNWERDGFNTDFGKIFRITDGGLAIMGGSLGIIVGIIYLLVVKYSLKKKPYTRMNYLHVIDVIVPSILIAQAIGRWGNFFNNEVHGLSVSASSYWFLNPVVSNNMAFSSAHRVGSLAYALEKLNSGNIYVPLFFIECLINISGYLVIEYLIINLAQKASTKIVLKNKSEGKKSNIFTTIFRIFTCEGSGLGYYLFWYGLTRAILEPLRDSEFNMGNDNNWSVNSSYYLMGIGLTIIIILGIWQVLRDNGKLKIKIEGEQNGN